MSDDRPICDCGEPMDVDRGRFGDVYRCSTGDCRSEGIRGPLHKLVNWLRSRWSA